MTDPRTLGCDCDRCPLALELPVLSEIRAGKPLIVGEAPGGEEEKQGAPFVGASGRELLSTLRLCGKDRSDVSLTNVLLCRPPGNKLGAYLRKLRRDAEVAGREFINPIECCSARLRNEVASAPAALLLGATAFAAVMGDSSGDAGLARMRGYPLALPPLQEAGAVPALATFHPAFVLRSRRWTETFRSDVAKFFRHSAGRLEWVDPEVLLDPSSSQLANVLSEFSAKDEIVGIDTETDGLDPETCGLRCIGLASTRAGIVLGFDSVEDPPRAFRGARPAMVAILRNWLSKHPRLAVHNQVFDRPILDRFLGRDALPWSRTLDTLVAHHLVDSELPHSLDFLASRFTDAPKWKPSDRLEWNNDFELHKYCALDCAVTARLAPMMSAGVRASEQVAVYLSDIRLQELAIQMHRAGMKIDEAERARHGKRLEQKAALAEKRAFAAAGRSLNLNSPMQVRELLFKEWMLDWSTVETDDGEPSTNKDALYEMLQAALPERVSEFLDALLEYRAAMRSLSKDVQGLEPDANGRVHPTWNPTGPVTGRLSCSDPQVQNVPSTKLDVESLRSMYLAAPGNVFVCADLEQAELRMVALIAGDSVWLDAFARGDDVHKLNASAFFGKPAEAISKSERDFAKTITYMFLYSGGAARAAANMRKVRDPKTGIRPHAAMSLSEASALRAKFLKAHPAIERWWKKTENEFKSQRLLREPVLGRIRRFLDGGLDEESLTELANFRIQSGIASLMSGSRICGATMDVLAAVGVRPGIIHHGHDSLLVECREAEADRVAKILESTMSQTVEVEGRRISIPAKAKVGKRWSDV